MKLLLDTQVFLWMVGGSDRVPEAVRQLLRSPDNEVWLSAISVWEMAIKQGRDRLTLPAPAAAYAALQRKRHAIGSLPIEEAAVAHLAKIPDVHRDPFDRVLVCQAIEHDMTLVSADTLVQRYPVKVLWSADAP